MADEALEESGNGLEIQTDEVCIAESLIGFINNLDVMIDKIYLIARTNFLALARFDFTVNAYQAILDNPLRAAAAFGQTLELEDLEKFDKLGFEFGDDFVRIIRHYSSKSICISSG